MVDADWLEKTVFYGGRSGCAFEGGRRPIAYDAGRQDRTGVRRAPPHRSQGRLKVREETGGCGAGLHLRFGDTGERPLEILIGRQGVFLQPI
jgi:hypothetical protein